MVNGLTLFSYQQEPLMVQLMWV